MQKNKRMGKYEGMYILSSTLSEDARKQALEKIKTAIVEKEGEIQTVIEWGQRKLLYKIKNDGATYSQGYYYILGFNAPTAAILELNAESKFNEDLIRSMILRVEKDPTIDFKPLKETV